MHIHALNTMEIRLTDAPDPGLEQRLQGDLARLQAMTGCLSYVLTRSRNQPDLWILSGYWSDGEEMTAHFNSQAMATLIDALIELGAQLNFAIYAPMSAERRAAQ